MRRFQLLLVAAGATIAMPVATPADEIADQIEECLLCHGDADMVMSFEDGYELSLLVDADRLAASVHGGELGCADCHQGYDEDHPFDRGFATYRAYQLAEYELCEECHVEVYASSVESVHSEAVRRGSLEAPVCSDCHGAHDTPRPADRSLMMSRSCGRCHDEVYEAYGQSVHGAALDRHISDAPACADCHTAHSVQPSHDLGFHLASPELCLECHSSVETMDRYGLTADVGDTYVADFHGVTASLADPATVEPQQVTAVCVDCHGVHDIGPTGGAHRAEIRARLVETCRRCHEDASPDFPGAWMSHYRPSLQHAPLVFLVIWFYRVIIPFMIVGLGVQIGLNLYRTGLSR